MKFPISLMIDDPSPVLSVYYTHHKTGFTDDGRPIIRNFPNSFLFDFCDIVEKYGIKGKFSVVPMPGNFGDIISGIDGVDFDEMKIWLDTVKKRIVPNFSICPEMLTHNEAIDLKTGKSTGINEKKWSNMQDRTTLTPYIEKALSILKEAGFDVCGVWAPWYFADEVEEEYVVAISKAIYNVYGKKNAWYYLHALKNEKNVKPWIAYEEEGRKLVSIPVTVSDMLWQTIHTTENDEEYINSIADSYITADGKSGKIIEVLDNGSYPIMLTHWQSLASNGLYTGVRILDKVAQRVNDNLSDKVQWTKTEDLMNYVVNNRDDFGPQEYTVCFFEGEFL